MNLSKKLIFALLILCVAAVFLCNLFFGAVHIDASEVWNALKGNDRDSIISYIIFENRMPQAVTALLGGAALAVTGLMLQTAFRNPLAGPSILGISSGASLGVALVMLALGGTISIGSSSIGGYAAIIVAASIGSLAITGLLTLISLRVRNNLMLLIVGIMTGYLTSSVVTLLSSLTNEQSLQGYVIWGMGSFAQVSLQQLPMLSILIILGLLGAMLMAKPLNILLLGDNYALNLGIRVERVKTWLLIVTGLLTAVVTAFCGPISFIGLAMPHIARLITRTDNHWVLMPATMLVGSIVALGCNCLSVMPQSNVIPLNALTPIVGVPVILYVILAGYRK